MPAKPTHKDGPRPSSIVPSTGTHVVAVLALSEGEADVVGYVRNLGDTRNGWTTQDEARRFDEVQATKIAAMHSQVAERAKRPERFEAREFEDLFGGEA